MEERSAFREAEKRYALRKLRVRRRWQVADLDISDIVDARDLPRNDSGAAVLSRHDGLVILPCALTIHEEAAMARLVLEQIPHERNRTNLGVSHGSVGGLWEASRRGESLASCGSDRLWTGAESLQDGIGGPPASHLLHKLRWTSLGAAYDWSTRAYHQDDRGLPLELECLAKDLLNKASANVAGFRPEAALVNFYRPGDTLCGHIDDAEADMGQPLVSVSLGCTAVFLMGGYTRDEEPTPILLRGGDAVVLMGEARKCYHGVPRVFGRDFSDSKHLPSVQLQDMAEELREFAEYLQHHRINISMRKVW